MYSVKESLMAVQEVTEHVRVMADSPTASNGERVTLDNILKELAHVETTLKRLKREGIN